MTVPVSAADPDAGTTPAVSIRGLPAGIVVRFAFKIVVVDTTAGETVTLAAAEMLLEFLPSPP